MISGLYCYYKNVSVTGSRGGIDIQQNWGESSLSSCIRLVQLGCRPEGRKTDAAGVCGEKHGKIHVP
jgi:hypothetical protein